MDGATGRLVHIAARAHQQTIGAPAQVFIGVDRVDRVGGDQVRRLQLQRDGVARLARTRWRPAHGFGIDRMDRRRRIQVPIGGIDRHGDLAGIALGRGGLLRTVERREGRGDVVVAVLGDHDQIGLGLHPAHRGGGQETAIGRVGLAQQGLRKARLRQERQGEDRETAGQGRHRGLRDLGQMPEPRPVRYRGEPVGARPGAGYQTK